MSADLSIHIFEGINESHLRRFSSNTMGSKYFNPSPKYDSEIFGIIGDTPSIWIGEVSWLKAGLFEDEDAYIPTPVGDVVEIIGEELPIIDEEFIVKIDAALKLENITGYKVTEPEPVIAFLRKHIGKQVFTVSW